MQTAGVGPCVSHAQEFAQVLGEEPRLTKVVDADAPEGPVYVADQDALYLTSLPRIIDIPTPGSRTVALRRLQLGGSPERPGRTSLERARPCRRGRTASAA